MLQTGPDRTRPVYIPKYNPITRRNRLKKSQALLWKLLYVRAIYIVLSSFFFSMYTEGYETTIHPNFFYFKRMLAFNGPLRHMIHDDQGKHGNGKCLDIY